MKLTANQANILNPKTIRQRTQVIYQQALAGKGFFKIHPQKMDVVVDFVLEVMQKHYPEKNIPTHGRFEHLRVGGRDRVAEIKKKIDHLTPIDQARVLIDLTVVSVLLDTTAGPDWKFKESNQEFTRSEGLAVASYHLFESGIFSDNPAKRLAATSTRLQTITMKDFQRGFQISEKNSLEGLEARLSLLNRLGQSLEAFDDYFKATTSRPGNLINWIVKNAHHNEISATAVLESILIGFSKLWPTGLSIDGLNVEDAWEYQGVQVPFHRLAQWLTYSLIQPIEIAGIRVTGIEQLTGLSELRNCGLFIDMGVLELRDESLRSKKHLTSDSLIIEWRALTIQLLDSLSSQIRKRLNKTENELSLVQILQGGTWCAGREIANKLRPDGSPPLIF